MKKNVASQVIGAQMVSATDGSAFTGAVTIYVTIDGGTQAVGTVGSGACTHEGNGFHTYAPSQAETNGDHIGYTFIGTGAVPATIQLYTTFPQTGDSFARLGAPAGASVSADIAVIDGIVDNILVDTAEIGAAGAGLTALASASALATVDANVDAILVDTGTDIPASIAALNDLDAAAVAAATWNAATATYGTAGSYGLLIETNLDAPVSGATAPTAAAVADAVWDEAIAGHLSAGSTGESLNAAGGSGDPWVTTLPGSYTGSQAGKILSDVLTDTGTTLPATLSSMSGATFDTATDSLEAIRNRGDAAWVTGAGGSAPTVGEIADAVWDEALSGHVTAGTAGKAMADIETDASAILVDTGTTIPGTIATVDANVDAILVDTGTTLPATLATIDANVDAVLVDTGTTIPAAIPTATENADALLNRDMSAVSDTTARSPLNALRFLRNKYSIAGTTLTVTKEDDSTSAWTSTLTTNASAEPVTGSDPA